MVNRREYELEKNQITEAEQMAEHIKLSANRFFPREHTNSAYEGKTKISNIEKFERIVDIAARNSETMKNMVPIFKEVIEIVEYGYNNFPDESRHVFLADIAVISISAPAYYKEALKIALELYQDFDDETTIYTRAFDFAESELTREDILKSIQILFEDLKEKAFDMLNIYLERNPEFKSKKTYNHIYNSIMFSIVNLAKYGILVQKCRCDEQENNLDANESPVKLSKAEEDLYFKVINNLDANKKAYKPTNVL